MWCLAGRAANTSPSPAVLAAYRGTQIVGITGLKLQPDRNGLITLLRGARVGVHCHGYA
jgi:hypothetical protein